MLARAHAYPCEVCAHRWLTPWIVSVFPLSRVIVRGPFTPRGLAASSLDQVPSHCRATIGTASFTLPVPTQVGIGPRVSLHARIAPLPLFGSMLSETPGARQPLSSHVH